MAAAISPVEPYFVAYATRTSMVIDQEVVEMRGLEPLTPAMRTRCSSG
jgi:hypothetical protein